MKVLSFALQTVRLSCGRENEEEMTVECLVRDFIKTIFLSKYFFYLIHQLFNKVHFFKESYMKGTSPKVNFLDNADNVISSI